MGMSSVLRFCCSIEIFRCNMLTTSFSSSMSVLDFVFCNVSSSFIGSTDEESMVIDIAIHSLSRASHSLLRSSQNNLVLPNIGGSAKIGHRPHGCAIGRSPEAIVQINDGPSCARTQNERQEYVSGRYRVHTRLTRK